MRDHPPSLDDAAARFLADEAKESRRDEQTQGGSNELAGAAALTRIAGAEPGWSAAHGPQTGMASFYGTSQKGDRSGDGFAGRPMANGAPMDPTALIAAHKTLPFGSLVRVRRSDGSREVTVTITDRGPYAKGRILDLSPAAARALDMIELGHAAVELSLISQGSGQRQRA